ncbi:MAG TPA: peptidoglycan DD-metalloendopeptidase family protein [Thermoanaerobaculia bacterium]|nr:peptidoglycan DD-metalloendopeptidase family protein [Thermoanaerobaculia bacterium]
MQWRSFFFGPHILRVALPLGLLLLAGGLFESTRNLEAYNQSPYPLPPSLPFNQRATLPTESSGLIDQAQIPVEFTLLRGETVDRVFLKLGLDSVEARKATNALAEHVNLRSLRAGNEYSAFFNPDSSLASFELTLAGSGRVEMVREGEGWQTLWQPFKRTVELRAVQGDVQGSLDHSIRRVGGPTGLAFRVADVLQWDLDFAKDLQRGDRFQVLYEAILLEGEPYAIGNIVAVAYENRGKMHEAYRYGETGTYYDGEGRPLKKMFLRSPLRYSRVTSNFTHRRFHPVLKIYRPHWGVDYGAPVGTPVQVTANGTVTFTGWDRGGGNVVKVKHADGYMTAYLHLSKFARGIRPGVKVRQGDIIAYTGATGLASGPHLDYRVQHHNKWIDPLSLKSVRDEAIPSTRLAAFRSWRNDIRASLDGRKDPNQLPWMKVAPQAPETQLALQDVAADPAPLRGGAVAR